MMSAATAGTSDGSPVKSVASSNSAAVAASNCRRHKDPVSLYQKYRDSWEKHKPPGTDSRLKLRWDIREQFYNQHDHEDAAGSVEKDKKNTGRCNVNTYVAPTDKSRMRLRWQIRMDLARGIVPTQTYTPNGSATDAPNGKT